jgi:hypothetical protein
MTTSPIFTSQPNEMQAQPRRLSRRGLSLMVGAAALAAAVTVGAVMAARQPAVEPAPAGNAAVYHDLNELALYRASEWDQPAAVTVPEAWHDLSALTQYRASEWGAPAADSKLERVFEHLMLVK